MSSNTPTPERYARVKEIFLEVCARPASEQGAALSELCGADADLRREVEELLFHHAEATVPTGEDGEPTAPETIASPAAERFAAGDMFAERYRIVAPLGRGGMGVVYRAHDLVLDDTVALKFVRAGRARQLEPTLNEVRLARQITHPNVCRVFDIGEVEGEYFFSMEYIDGEDLRSLLKRIGRLPQDKVLDVARQLLAGLAAAHARGILHRDLKPANIMIDGRGRVRITDFGVAAEGGAGGAVSVAGTPAYMAPEQLTGNPSTEQSDLYSLALVLYELLTGESAFSVEQIRDFLELRLTARPEAPGDLVSDLDPQLERVILQALDRDPRERPTSALAMAASLPGADPLAVALEAGVTPAPEVVAAAGRDGALRPGQALALLLTTVVLLGIVLFLAGGSFRLAEAGLMKSPEVLADRADGTLRQLGYEPPADRAWGFLEDLEQADAERSILFWYRESAEPMMPEDIDNYLFGGAQVDLVDPPLLYEGMRMVFLEPDGRFVYLEAVPPLEIEDPEAPLEPPPWDDLLAFAGLSRSALEETAPKSLPAFYADTLGAWRGDDPLRPGHRVEVEAATLRGQLVYFELAPPEEELDEAQADVVIDQWNLAVDFSRAFYLIPLLALPVAVRNLRRNRGDPRGARRVAGFVVLLRLAIWLLGASHVPTFYGEATLFLGALAALVLDALFFWVSYLALEPYVRRLWPQTLIAWSRLLSGRWRDPLVGRSLLVGSLLGVLFTVVTQIDRMAPAWLGLVRFLSPVDSQQLNTALSARQLFTTGLDQVLAALYAGVLALLLFVLLRFLLRHPTLSALAFVLVLGTLEVLEGSHPAISAVTLGLGVALPAALVLVRLGLLAYIAARTVNFLLLTCPLTTDLDAWYFPSGLFAVVVVVTIAGFGFHTALAGRPLFVDPLPTPTRRTGST